MVVPERMTQRQEVRTALAAQFWELPVSSARSLGDGAAGALPCEPAPLAALAPQGAVRAQQLLAMQAGVGPLTPGYDGSNGGVVRVSFLFLSSSFLFVSRFLFSKTPSSSFRSPPTLSLQNQLCFPPVRRPHSGLRRRAPLVGRSAGPGPDPEALGHAREGRALGEKGKK